MFGAAFGLKPLPEHRIAMKGRVLLNIVFFISVANFLAFCAISEVIGGDAINGYAEHGRYFLRSHGRRRQFRNLNSPRPFYFMLL